MYLNIGMSYKVFFSIIGFREAKLMSNCKDMYMYLHCNWLAGFICCLIKSDSREILPEILGPEERTRQIVK